MLVKSIAKGTLLVKTLEGTNKPIKPGDTIELYTTLEPKRLMKTGFFEIAEEPKQEELKVDETPNVVTPDVVGYPTEPSNQEEKNGEGSEDNKQSEEEKTSTEPSNQEEKNSDSLEETEEEKQKRLDEEVKQAAKETVKASQSKASSKKNNK